MPLWLILSLIATVFWATAQILVKKGFEHISPLWNNVFSNFFRLIIWLPVVLVLSKFSIKIPTPMNLLIIFIAACLYMFLFYALSKGTLALTATIVAMNPLFSVFLSILFLKEHLTISQLIGVVIILSGGLLIALPSRKVLKKTKDWSWLIWGTATAVSIGIGDFLTKVSVNKIGAYSHLFYISLIFQLLSVANYLIDKKGRNLPKVSKANFLPTLSGTAILWFGSLLYFLSFDYGPASLITPVASTYSILTVILAVTFLKEKITLKQALGIFFAVAGVILIGI